MIAIIKTSVLLPTAIIFVTFLLLINTSEHLTTDTAKTLNDKDQSNSIGKQQNIEMSIKNEPSAVSNDNSNFTSIFDGKTLDGWNMAGEGRFVIIESDAALQSEGGMGLFGIQITNTRILY
jgi:hypothetical protein